jgi:signal transduction histidine kinase
MEPGRAIGVSLFLAALAYLPARALIWERVSHRHKLDQARLLRAMADVALQPTPERREAAWRALLDDLYAPLDIVAARQAEAEGDDEAVGRALRAPGPEGFPALILRDRDRGRALFTPDDAATVRELSALVTYLGESRTAYDRGAAFERVRIARDIHDNIGA